MAKYFTSVELTQTNYKIPNVPSSSELLRLIYLMDHLLDPIRSRWGAPIKVNSGYRSPELNRRVGGAVNSQHLKGEAADITTGTISGNKMLFDLIRTMQADREIVFDQLIDEKNYSWLHVSIKSTGNRNQILHLP